MLERTHTGLIRSSSSCSRCCAQLRRGWSDADVAKVAGENVLRVLAATE